MFTGHFSTRPTHHQGKLIGLFILLEYELWVYGGNGNQLLLLQKYHADRQDLLKAERNILLIKQVCWESKEYLKMAYILKVTQSYKV